MGTFYKGLILKSYLKANYPIELDSSNYIKSMMKIT